MVQINTPGAILNGSGGTSYPDDPAYPASLRTTIQQSNNNFPTQEKDYKYQIISKEQEIFQLEQEALAAKNVNQILYF